jgi:hypothetical protein
MLKPAPFDLFLKKTAEARPEDYPGVDPGELDRMKRYLLDTLYKNVHPVRTTVESGQTIDWIPYSEQPAVRAAAAKGVSLPRPPSDEPVRFPRVTLDDLTRFGTLENYHRKIPIPAKGQPPIHR